MAGRGPRPKDPGRRAGKSRDPHPFRVMTVDPVEQPALPESLTLATKDSTVEVPWPARTLEWWQMWADSPLADDFTSTDWSELLDTAVLHARLWMGQTTVAPELRLRVAKFGATPEDRARLRIVFAQADAVEDRVPVAPSSRERRGALKAL